MGILTVCDKNTRINNILFPCFQGIFNQPRKKASNFTVACQLDNDKAQGRGGMYLMTQNSNMIFTVFNKHLHVPLHTCKLTCEHSHKQRCTHTLTCTLKHMHRCTLTFTLIYSDLILSTISLSSVSSYGSEN